MIFCFLLVACFRLALIFINPEHKSHITTKNRFLAILNSIYLFGYNCFYVPYLNAMDFILYQIFIYLPIWIRYRWIRTKLIYRWGRLSWQWWLILFCGHWNEPEPRPGKINGTYWMHVREDMYFISDQLKELNRFLKRLDRSYVYRNRFSVQISGALAFASMILLTGFGICYFIARILLYRLNPSIFNCRMKRPWSKRRKRKRKTCHVHHTVLNLDDKVQDETVSFDTDSSHIVCDNSANVHICNDKSMFIGDLRKTDKHYVATIAGQKSAASAMGTVQWKWKDDNGKQHSYDIRDVLYFPTSPVNILSVTGFADQLNDDEGTGIDTKRSKSRFYWQNSQFQRTIFHSPSNLPELRINEGFTLSGLYSKAVSFKVNLTKKHCHCHASTLIPDDEENLHTVDIDSDLFHIGETLLYSNSGHTTYVKVEKIFLDDDSVLRFKCKTAGNEEIITTKESLRVPDSPDIGWIPANVPEKKQAAANLDDEEFEKISNPVQLSPLQEEFLALHERLWHLPFSVMFRMVKLGFLHKKFKKLGNKAPPCVSCLFGQAHKRPWRFKRTKKGEASTLRGEKPTKPGDTVGVDQLISAQPGLVAQEKGSMTRARIWAATVFVCYVTGYIHVALMTDQSGDQTLEAKHDFEHKCGTRGVDVKHYHADNGRFAEKSFLDSIKKCMQRITFCGVGAHHQNGITENTIKQLTLTSRTILLHAQSHWPEYITTMLWPFALKAAQDRMNQLNMDLDGRTPDMKFSGVAAHTLRLRDFHTFGCPVYVLDSRLQSSTMGVPKWEPRARLGIYVGRSASHAANVALVLNPKTGLVSPQFHVVFDDDFTTVPHLRKGTVPPNWEKLVTGSREKSTTEHYDLTKTWFEPSSDETANEILTVESAANEGGNISSTPNEGASSVRIPNEGASPTVTFDSIPTVTQDSEGESIPPQSQASEGDGGNNLFMPDMINLETAGNRRSPRLSSQKQKNYSLFSAASRFCTAGLVLATLLCSPVTVFSHGQACINTAVHQCNMVNANFDGTFNEIHHMVLAAGKSNNECYTFREMLKEDDAAEFVKAMEIEVNAHEKRDHWEVVKRFDVPTGTKTIQAVWSFKRKRFPDGSINKFKARLCAHGGMQQWGVNYWETYAPVVNWISVRFLLVLSEIVGLESRAIDFVLAFPQAELDVPVYMELPIGMEVPGSQQNRKLYLLRLKRSLYGLKQASANWYDMLKKGLQRRGLQESVADPCVFLRDNLIVLCYVDDCILLSPKKEIIDEFLVSLKHGPEQFIFTDEGDIERYLGVEVTRLDDDSGFKMTQPFLIERILQAAEIDTKITNDRPTPVVGPLLSRDENGPQRKHDWKYRTLTGMLGYLQLTSRPDISMATHQCARFNNAPMLCHERAIKRICKYLLGTMDKGMIFRPDLTKGLECHVDADFAGGWSSGDTQNPEAVLSRTGFVISYAGCPIYWASKLQTEIALSTTEAEYIALSMAMREVLPFLNLMQEINVVLPLPAGAPKFFCKVWEDNRSCIKVAESPKFTPRTKHIALKYHHFRRFVSDGTVNIFPIGTLEQTADIFTKPLDGPQFAYLRKKLCGW